MFDRIGDVGESRFETGAEVGLVAVGCTDTADLMVLALVRPTMGDGGGESLSSPGGRKLEKGASEVESERERETKRRAAAGAAREICALLE